MSNANHATILQHVTFMSALCWKAVADLNEHTELLFLVRRLMLLAHWSMNKLIRNVCVCIARRYQQPNAKLYILYIYIQSNSEWTCVNRFTNIFTRRHLSLNINHIVKSLTWKAPLDRTFADVFIQHVSLSLFARVSTLRCHIFLHNRNG